MLLLKAYNLMVKWFLDEKLIEVQIFLGLNKIFIWNNIKNKTNYIVRILKNNIILIIKQIFNNYII